MGEPVSTAAVAPTDYGLGNLSAAVQKVADAKDAIDTKTAGDVVQKSYADFAPKVAERAAAYDGREPGFAAQNLSAFDDHFAPLMTDPSLSSGVRQAVRLRVAALKTNVGAQVIDIESNKRAGIVAEQERVKTGALVDNGMMAFTDAFSKADQARADAFDGSDPDYAKGRMADFDAAAKDAVAGADPKAQPFLQQALDAKRVDLFAQTLVTQDHAHTAFVADHAQQTVNALVNNVVANPSAYDHSVGDVDTAAAGLPAGPLQRKFIEEGRAAMAKAHVEGLIFKGDTDQAKAELGDGRFDKIIKPADAEALQARIDAAERGGPKTLEQWRQAYEADSNLTAEVDARSRGATTGFNLQGIVGVFSPRQVAEAEQKLKQADQVFAATGNLKDQTNDELHSRAIAPAPALNDPLYGDKFKAWELSRKAAAGELEARQKDPAAWAMNSTTPNDTGAQLQARWQDFATAADPAAMGTAGAKYAVLSLGLQAKAGTPTSALRVFSKDEASQLAQSYARSPPEQRAAALQRLALTVSAMPTNVAMGDGRVLSAAGMALKELRTAGLGLPDIAAITDLRGNSGALGLYADATANPAAVKELTAPGAEKQLRSQVEGRLAPFFHTANAQPGSAELNYGREAEAMIVARHLVAVKGLSAGDAARQATADLADGYRYTDGWRMPANLADAPAGFMSNAMATVRSGAAYALSELVTTGGGQLAPPPGNDAMTMADRQKISAQQVEKMGRWMTTERDDGLQLMVGDPRGWTPMADKYGRPIQLSWGQLKAMDDHTTLHRAPYSWMAPPPNATLPPTADPAKAKAAFAAAIEGRETGGTANPVGAISPKGAAGVRQLMPATAQAAAQRLGIAYEPARLLTDPVYNRQLSDNELDHLSDHYNGNAALMAAGYNAGPAAVDGWIKRFGDPRTGKISADDFVAHIPYPETRAYVRNVLPRALANLRRGG